MITLHPWLTFTMSGHRVNREDRTTFLWDTESKSGVQDLFLVGHSSIIFIILPRINYFCLSNNFNSLLKFDVRLTGDSNIHDIYMNIQLNRQLQAPIYARECPVVIFRLVDTVDIIP